MTNLQKRILVAAIGFPILLLSAFDSRFFAAVIVLVMGVAWHEYLMFRMKLPKDFSEWFFHFFRIFLGILPPLFVLVGSEMQIALILLMLGLQIALIYGMVHRRSFDEIFAGLKFSIIGFAYITVLFSTLVAAQIQGGKVAIWFILFVVALTDTCAYFAGRKFGRTPFFQNISPSKTVEGVYGGLAGAVMLCLVFYFVAKATDHLVPPFFYLLVMGLIISVFSIFGDLFESSMKRFYGVKDSGSLLPGHGGVLDRFDAVMFASVPLLFFVVLRGGFR